MSNLRDTDRMSPAELPPEPDEPPAHASEHVAPHPVPRISAHKTMELDTVKVSDPALNSRNAPTQRGLRPPVIPPGYNPEADAGYVMDDVPGPPKNKPWLLIGGVGLGLLLLAGGLVFALTRGSATAVESASDADQQEASTTAAGSPAKAGDPAGSTPEQAAASAAAEPERAPDPEPAAEPPTSEAPKSEPPKTQPPKAESAKPAATATSKAPSTPAQKPASKDGKKWEEWM